MRPLLVAIFFCLLVTGFSTESNRILVLLDSSAQQGSFSLFFGDLEARGYKLTYAQADETSLELTHFGEYLFDHLVVFSPSSDALGGLTVQSILDFVDSGHNLILAGDSQGVGRQIAQECGVELAEPGFQVCDNFHGVDGDETVISFGGANLVNAPVVVGTKITKPVLFKGVSLSIPQQNGLHFSVLGGYDSTYSANPATLLKQEDLTSGIGEKLVLIAALQARNNARVLVSGSLAFFSDKFFRNSDNQHVANALSRWVFGETGILRVSNVTNHKKGDIEPSMYTVKDTIVYTATIQELVEDKWVPFKSDNVQLEVAMLSPYIRLSLKHEKDGHYKTSFVAPDVYGVFSFKLRFRKLGYTALDVKTIKSIRPYRHDEYPRFLATAHPYYASCLAVLAGIVIFSAFFLFTK